MFKKTEGAADCEIWSLIRFLNARSVLPSEIHEQICHLYGDNAASDGMVRKWVRMFNEGRENVYDEARSGHPSLVNDDLVHKVNERMRNDRRFTVSAVYCERLKKLRRAIQNKRRGMLSATILFLHDNARPTLLLRLKTSSPHLGGNKWTTPCTGLIWCQVLFTSS